MPLTDLQIRKLKPIEKQYSVTDGNGLSLLIMPNGSKLWRIRFYVGGKQQLMSAGPYPAVSLVDARNKNAEVHNQARNGIDPRNPYRLTDNQKTFREVAEEWFSKRKEEWSPKHIHTQELRLFNGIIPVIGHLKIADMVPGDYLALLKIPESRGNVETAHRYAHICGQISRYAMICGYSKFDVASGLAETLIKRKHVHFATITDKKEIGALLCAIDDYSDRSPVKFALRMMPYVFVRSGELRGARWDEFNFDEQLWTIPASRMKMRRPHTVPLARQVMAILKELHVLTGQFELLFPGLLDKKKPITDMALLNSLRRLGYAKDKMTIHGFRAMASTILNEKQYNPDHIETQLAHAGGNDVRKAYNRALYIEDRRKMMQEYADYLDSLRRQ